MPSLCFSLKRPFLYPLNKHFLPLRGGKTGKEIMCQTLAGVDPEVWLGRCGSKSVVRWQLELQLWLPNSRVFLERKHLCSGTFCNKRLPRLLFYRKILWLVRGPFPRRPFPFPSLHCWGGWKQPGKLRVTLDDGTFSGDCRMAFCLQAAEGQASQYSPAD